MAPLPRLMALGATLVIALGHASPAEAASGGDATARAERLGEQARDAFRAGDAERAIDLYLQAYETAPSAGFLFNIAFIYDRRLDEPELAAGYYRRVIDAPDADPDLIARARDELEAVAARRPAEPPPAPDTAPPRVAPTPGEGGPLGVEGRARPRCPARGVGPWVLMIGGGAALTGGVVLGAVAAGTESDFHAASAPDARRDLQATGRGQAVAADVMMFTGLAAAAGGLIWWLVEAPSGPCDDVVEAPRPPPAEGLGLRVAPAVVGDGAGLVIGGRL